MATAPRAATAARGFSIMELVMVLVIFGIVSAVAAPIAANGFRAYFTGRDIAETDSQARVAVERMTRELRGIRAPTDLTAASASDVSFVDTTGTSIRYCMGVVGGCPGVAGDLMRNSQPLAAGISALTFSFLSRGGAATGAATAFYVTIGFTATQNAVAKTYQATVSPRNFP
jgi:prepilin-type N-terminal cleavage/methylation domain-containing protein